LLPESGRTPETHLEPYHEKILAAIRERGFITDREYAKLVERAKATRALDFQKLVSLGLIERKGRGRATYYILKEAA
jgi:predicted HTH transcriptional regulator